MVKRPDSVRFAATRDGLCRCLIMLNLLFDIYRLFKSIDTEKRRRVLAYIKRRRISFALISSCLLISYWVDDYTYRRPERIIHLFYELIDDKDYRGAWNLLSDGYKDQMEEREEIGSFSGFIRGYSNTRNHSKIFTHIISVNNSDAKIVNRVSYTDKSSGEPNMPKMVCYLTELQKEEVSSGYDGPYSIIFGGQYLKEDWRIVINKYRNVCDDYGL